jgi:hypothetical protein
MGGIEGAANTAPNLPTVDLVDGIGLLTMDIAEPCWLYAGRITDDSGTSWRFTYHSCLLRASDQMYQRMLDYQDGAVQINTETVIDPNMMFGQAELSILG